MVYVRDQRDRVRALTRVVVVGRGGGGGDLASIYTWLSTSIIYICRRKGNGLLLGALRCLFINWPRTSRKGLRCSLTLYQIP